ncbi:MAG: toll/interleukin-1 receptor domain-containing protein [Anaerolineae bacterium]|nr:toll/interleukin-1 receptor domain-containing protein [Anaerolineae bacterium]
MTESFVFISHSSKDNDIVRKLGDDLRTNGIPVWIDFEAIEDGSRWLQRIEQGVRDCAAAVIVMSAGARESEWVEREALMLLDLGKPLFIAIIKPIPLPLHLITRQFTNFSDDYETGFENLANSLHDVLNQVPQAIANTTPQAKTHSPDPDESNFCIYPAIHEIVESESE